ncbi:MAG: Wzy polymerase domain-containing protein [Pseudomonadota bacterium]
MAAHVPSPTFFQRIPQIGAYLSLVCVGLMWIFPFIYYYHQFPLTTFYGEWGAAVLGLCAASALVVRSPGQQAEIPRIILLPLGMAVLVLVQYACGKAVYFSHTLLVILYLLWAGLLMVLGHKLRQQLGMPVLAARLAAFVLVGAELSALAGILQNYPWRTFMDYVVTVKSGAGLFGNMGQPNHFADYTTLGLVSLGLLRLRWRLRLWVVVLLAAPLLFVLVLSGSRTAWLYLLSLAAMSYIWRRRDKSYLPLLNYSLLLVLGFGLMHLVVQIPWLAGPYGNVTTVERMVEQGVTSFGAAGSSSIRLHIWYEAWLILQQFPFLGAGFGMFGWQHFLLGPELRDPSIYGLYNNAHNLIIQIAAEMGLIGVLILLVPLALWMRQAWRAPRSVEHWWGYGLLLVLGIHSLLEYPLWYAYFLSVAAMMLGMLDHTVLRWRLSAAGRALIGVILLLGAYIMWQTYQGYSKLELLNSYIRPESLRDDSVEQRVHSQRIREALLAIPDAQTLLLEPYIEYALSKAGWDHVGDNRAMNERVMRFAPVAGELYREALLLARAGKHAAAQEQMERAIWAFPADFPATLEKLEALAAMDPEPQRFPALLAFSLQKYQEWQRASEGRR